MNKIGQLWHRWRPELGRILRFGLVGLLNTAIGLGTIYVLQLGFGVDYRLANTAGYALGIVNSFVLNRIWTFKSRDTRVARQGLLFLLVAGVIEGNVSPAKLPNEVKYGVAALTAVAMTAYLALGRDDAGDAATAPRAP